MADSPRVAAGQLRHRIKIQTLTRGRGANKGVIETWVTTTTVWGDIQPVSGRETVDANRMDSRVTHEIEIRYYSAGFTPDNRLQDEDGNNYNIEVVKNIGRRNRRMLIQVIENT